MQSLSLEQQAMLRAIEAELAPPHAYQLPRAWLVEGAFDLSACQHAWACLQSRHPLLTARLARSEEGDFLVPSAGAPAVFHVQDWGASPDFAERLEQLQYAEATDAFDIEQSLSRLCIHRLSPDCHLLCVTLHHLISDATSFHHLAIALEDAYAAAMAGQGTEPAPSVPPSQAIGQVTPRYCAASETLDTGLAQLTETYARANGTSRFGVLAAAMLLHLVSRVGHVRVSLHYARRVRNEAVIDCTVELRELMPPVNSAFTDLRGFVQHVREALADPMPQPRRVELGQAIGWGINKNTNFRTPLRLAGLAVRELERAVVNNPIQRNLSIIELDPQTVLRLESHLEEDAGRLPEQLRECVRTLDGLLRADPQQPVRDFVRALCPPAIRAAAPDWRSVRLSERFHQMAAACPEQRAVEHRGIGMSYRELSGQVKHCSRHLETLGVRRGDVVGSTLEPGLPLVVLFLSLLSVGAVHAPMPAGASAEYLAGLRAATNARFVLSEADVDEALAQPANAPDTATAAERHEPSGASEEDAPVYCLSTSGSSGVPKAVLVCEAAVVNLLRDWQTHVDQRSGLRHSWWTAPTFDVSIWEMLLPLMSGGTLVIVPAEMRNEPAELLAWQSEAGIDVAYLPPHVMRDLHDSLHTNVRLPDLILTGVEPLDEAAVARVLVRPRLVNAYGPTEATVYATRHLTDLADLSRRIAIGKAIQHTHVRVLDGQFRECAAGQPGGICISGAGLAAGYLGRSRATAAAFVPDPYGAPGARMYLTGDMGRYREDGQLEYLRRADRQAKVNGVRIELDHVENAAAAHHGVKQARAVIIKQGDYDAMVLFVTRLAGAGLTAQGLAAKLSESLAPYQRLHRIVILDAFPLTPHGKVDDAALREHQSLGAKPAASAEVVPDAATGPVATIRSELSHLLGRQVDDAESLRDLELTSVATITLIERLKKQGISLRFSQFYRCRSVEELAQCSPH